MWQYNHLCYSDTACLFSFVCMQMLVYVYVCVHAHNVCECSLKSQKRASYLLALELQTFVKHVP